MSKTTPGLQWVILPRWRPYCFVFSFESRRIIRLVSSAVFAFASASSATVPSSIFAWSTPYARYRAVYGSSSNTFHSSCTRPGFVALTVSAGSSPVPMHASTTRCVVAAPPAVASSSAAAGAAEPRAATQRRHARAKRTGRRRRPTPSRWSTGSIARTASSGVDAGTKAPAAAAGAAGRDGVVVGSAAAGAAAGAAPTSFDGERGRTRRR